MLKKVLIIEDDTDLRNSIAQTLELEDLEPVALGGFIQARRSIRFNFKGVILSDIQMPEHDGFDVLKFAQTRDPDLPVILLTGYADIPTAKQAMKEGAYDFLEKPCAPDTLVDVLKRALQHRQLVIENRHVRDRLKEVQSLDATGPLSVRLEAHERRIIEEALIANDGKVSKVASILGLARNTLYDRMAKLGITARDFR